MINITTWSPDTCGCTLHFWWDDTLPMDERVHHPIDAVELEDNSLIETKRCQAHKSHDDVDVLHEKALGENQGKNIALHEIAKEFPELAVDDGKGNLSIKEGAVSFSFDKDRVLQLKVEGLMTTKEKKDMQALVDEKRGSGKVKIT